ncbi:MAG: hypothetical protein HY549_01805 [Elusimicrobia bacterium]|nr:hypothetical protein [Elusimicrobiota bacterium]
MIHAFIATALLAAAEPAKEPEPRALHDIFRGTAICGKPVPETAALQAELSAIPEGPHSARVSRFFDILDVHLSKGLPRYGDCHWEDVAIDPAAIAEIAANNPQAIARMERLASKIKTSGSDRADWYYFLARLRGFKSRPGKAHLKHSHQLFSDYYSANAGEQSDAIYREVLKLTKSPLPRRWTLMTTPREFGCGKEYSVEREPSLQHRDWLKLVLELGHSCWPGEYAAEPNCYRLSLDRIHAHLEQPRFKTWAGAHLFPLIESLVQSMAKHPEPDPNLTIEQRERLSNAHKERREILLRAARRRFSIKTRSSNC